MGRQSIVTWALKPVGTAADVKAVRLTIWKGPNYHNATVPELFFDGDLPLDPGLGAGDARDRAARGSLDGVKGWRSSAGAR